MATERIKNERAIKALKPGVGRVNDGGGLYLAPFGWQQSHYWRMDYTHQGRRRTLTRTCGGCSIGIVIDYVTRAP